MSGLQEAFYIVSIVYMGVMFILLIALVSAVFVIRSKINKIHDAIDSKINAVTSLAEKGGGLAGMAAKTVVKQAKKSIRKKK